MSPRFSINNSPCLALCDVESFRYRIQAMALIMLKSHVHNLRICQLGIVRIFAKCSALRRTEVTGSWTWDMTPRSILSNQSNNHVANGKVFANLFSRFATYKSFNDLYDIRVRQFRLIVLFASQKQSILTGVSGIALMSAVFKVRRSIVTLLCVFMINQHASRTWANKSKRNNLMNATGYRFVPSALQGDAEVCGVSTGPRLKDRDLDAPHSSYIRSLVAGKSGNVTPLFIFQLFWSKFMVSHCGFSLHENSLRLGSFRDSHLRTGLLHFSTGGCVV